MPGFRFDHGIIAVLDLSSAIEDYRALGFNVRLGGEHAGGHTKNALIGFADGSYLELLAPTDTRFMDKMETVDMSSFLDFVAQGDGWAGFALHAEDLDAALQGMRDRGLPVGQPVPNSRLRPDGEILSWRTIDIGSSRVPFFIEDQTSRRLRVPDDAEVTTHDNGATGIDSIVIAVQNLDKAVKHYEAMLDQTAEQPGPEVNKADTAGFTLGETRLILAAPDQYDSPVQAYLDDRGEVPYELRLRTHKADQARVLNYRKLHRARIELVHQ